MPKFKIVIDTNIWLSGIFWGGNPGKVLQLWRDSVESGVDNFKIVFSKSILQELSRKLKAFEKKYKEERVNLQEWITIIESQGIFVKPEEKITVCRDSKDNKFLEAALAAEADFIISGDQDLLILEEFKGTKIVNAKNFLKHFNY